MLVRIGESEKEPRFVNVRLVIVVIIQSISFDVHQKKYSACVLTCYWNITGRGGQHSLYAVLSSKDFLTKQLYFSNTETPLNRK